MSKVPGGGKGPSNRAAAASAPPHHAASLTPHQSGPQPFYQPFLYHFGLPFHPPPTTFAPPPFPGASAHARKGPHHDKPLEESAPAAATATPQQQQQPRGRPKKKKKRRDSTSSGSTKRKSRIKIKDDFPNRLVNPLLELPWEEGPPNAAHLLALLDITHAQLDTYPLSYYARLLGFDVPPLNAQASWKSCIPIQPKTLPIIKDAAIYAIPPLGTWFRQAAPETSLTYMDPVYASLKKGVPPTLTRSTTVDSMPPLSADLLKLARELQYLNPAADTFTINMDKQAFFFELSLGERKCAKCCYDFSWVPLQELMEQKSIPTEYGMPSAVAHLKKPSVSELVLHVHSICTSESSMEHVLVVMAQVLQHARANNVWYALVHVDESLQVFLQQYFGMESIPCNRVDSVALLCDLHQCSFRHAFLKYKQDSQNKVAAPPTKTRLLVRLPTYAAPTKKGVSSYSSVKESLRGVAFGVRLSKQDGLQQLNANQEVIPGPMPTSPTWGNSPPPWQVIKSFQVIVPRENEENEGDLLATLRQKQSELQALEGGMEPKLRSLLEKVVEERYDFESQRDTREKQQQVLQSYQEVVQRRKDLDTAFQQQLEQDMDAVCDICRDGTVSPDNQIIFCEACNVAVHQFCYGIEKIPEQDYYCIPCRYYGRERKATVPLPIVCELCPQKQGAFCQSLCEIPDAAKWVHSACAKWQGLNFVPLGQTDIVEDVSELKKSFRRLGYRCLLCGGRRGAYANCRDEDCDNWMHVTCARASGLCQVVHGEDCHGAVEDDAWTILCPFHSGIEEAPEGAVTIEELKRQGKDFKDDPEPEPDKPRRQRKVASANDRLRAFTKMNWREREAFLADDECEQELLQELMKRLPGVHCEACHQYEATGKNLARCYSCGIVVCASCILPCDGVDEENKEFLCIACKYVREKKEAGEEFEQPQCNLCLQKGGWLREGCASPVNKRSYWKQRPDEFAKTYFVKDLWCHTICTMWHPKVGTGEDGRVDCTNVIMSNGLGHIHAAQLCALCGQSDGVKVDCSEVGCRGWGEKRLPYHFHVTCAREAGLEIIDKVTEDGTGNFYFDAKCFRHSGSDFVFRARMEDLIEIERIRAGPRFEKRGLHISFPNGSRLLNKAIIVMRMLGWAWRWAEWWVEYGDNWEPLLEPGQKEEEMTKEELKIVDSTRESRCEAARKCRLAALGAALRNREYDKEENDDRVALDRALRAVLHTPPLVGPLEQYEIDFFAEWLARAYRSKSRLLGYGDDKIPVKEGGYHLHVDDKSPKYILGSRRLPGKQELPEGSVFETDFEEVDDFLKPETFADGSLVTADKINPMGKKRKRRGRPPKAKVRENVAVDANEEAVAEERSEEVPVEEEQTAPVKKKKRIGRPPKSAQPKTPKRVGRPPKSAQAKALAAEVASAVEAAEASPRRGRRSARTPKPKSPFGEEEEEEAVDSVEGESKRKRKRRKKKKRSSEESAESKEPTRSRKKRSKRTTASSPDDDSPARSTRGRRVCYNEDDEIFDNFAEQEDMQAGPASESDDEVPISSLVKKRKEEQQEKTESPPAASSPEEEKTEDTASLPQAKESADDTASLPQSNEEEAKDKETDPLASFRIPRKKKRTESSASPVARLPEASEEQQVPQEGDNALPPAQTPVQERRPSSMSSVQSARLRGKQKVAQDLWKHRRGNLEKRVNG